MKYIQMIWNNMVIRFLLVNILACLLTIPSFIVKSNNVLDLCIVFFCLIAGFCLLTYGHFIQKKEILKETQRINY